ncbi:MAG: UDP-3-O-(3-hydroxymyristoyl)glucosamine N-acyltransferase [Firmicutes bacterium]|nr:UDP-3-O-(3-hydroxymyristoyl)glucosamine N-acyltransferase [Bacillota bacterium]
MQFTVAELSRITGASVVGDASTVVTGIASVGDSRPGDITLALDQRRLKIAHSREQAAVIVPLDLRDQLAESKCYLVSADPKVAFARVLELFDPGINLPDGVSPLACVSTGVKLGPGVRIGPFAFLGPGSEIGADTVISAGVYIGAGVRVGQRCVLFPNCVILDRCEIGDRVRVHAGCVIGADGFGYTFDGTRHVKIPQIGRVVIEDDVELGANSCVDRATTGVTRVRRGTKIDNLVQIGHNCDIGSDCVIVAQSGVGGSSELGERCIVTGQVGISDHTTVGPGTTIMAKSVVAGKVAAGSVLSGVPARDHRTELKTKSMLRRLPELLDEVDRLGRRVKELEERLADASGEQSSR